VCSDLLPEGAVAASAAATSDQSGPLAAV